VLAGDAYADGGDGGNGSAVGDVRMAPVRHGGAPRRHECHERDLTMAALPRQRYGHAVEPACGVGLVTATLAERAEAVSASDPSRRAVSEARTRCAGLPNVVVSRRDVRDGPPAQPFDLAVLRNVLDDMDDQAMVELVRRWHVACAPGGHLLLAHHVPDGADGRAGGGVQRITRAVLGPPAVEVGDHRFRVDVFDAPPV
jgi:SAM-dependent methyltransferase